MKTVLVVDDEFDTVASLQMLLAMEGYRVITARDGEEALTKTANEKPDLVVTDRMMPRMDGIELCKRLRQNPASAAIPIVLVSGVRDDKLDGARLYDVALRKPARFEELRRAVRNLLTEAANADRWAVEPESEPEADSDSDPGF
jgi:DNA-binding response OmpR family regulator